MIGTILCIEDEDELREDLVEELREAGYSVREAADGINGLRMAPEERVFLVLCDVRLPGLGGVELFKKLQDMRKQSSVTVIFLTAFNDAEMIDILIRIGAYQVFVKPFDYDELLSAVAKVENSFRNPT